MAIAATHPVIAEKRQQALFDPWFRALYKDDEEKSHLLEYYDPAKLQRKIAVWRECEIPFSAYGLETQQFRDMFPSSKEDAAGMN